MTSIPSRKSKGAKFISQQFFKIAKSRKADVNFGILGRPGPCGTVACHGGWATEFDGFEEWSEGRGCAWIDFSDGANYLAHLLGFDDWGDFVFWAKENPSLWGSEDGDCMFGGGGYRAFGFTHKDKNECTLEFIAQWYANLCDRLERAGVAVD